MSEEGTDTRLICPIHGDIGSVRGLEGNLGISFNIDKEEKIFCLKCIKSLLEKEIPLCTILELEVNPNFYL